MHGWKALFATIIVMLAFPQAAQAERSEPAQHSATQIFGIAPVTDSALADVRGGSAPFATLTVGSASRIIDDNARFDLRLSGGVARVEMDVWWGSTGSELIAQSVRTGGAP